MKQVKFKVTQINDLRKNNSVLELNNTYIGSIDSLGRIYWTDPGSQQAWTFYPEEYELISE